MPCNRIVDAGNGWQVALILPATDEPSTTFQYELTRIEEANIPSSIEKPKVKLDNPTPPQDNEEVLFVREIKLNRSSNVIDMDVEVKGRK